ncbi:MAG TPA: UDP-3-O-(3-hydroxymyristoyl)glucosamine N-acyltransferase, partial [Gemmatimonadaceae bacterium]|nr:UDP-3-O-(3-hydroxymyristoyl)glucosamine N-acyltransferase [Gemmatimonadaceae bacterium]
TLTARAIADLVGGELRGDGSTEVDSVAPLGRAAENQLSFLADGRYAPAFAESLAGIVLITPDLAETPGAAPARVVVDKPQEAMLQLLPRLYPVAAHSPSIDPTARIGRGAAIGAGVTLEPYTVIGDGATIGDGVWIGSGCAVGKGVKIGKGSRLFPGVTIYSGSEIGERSVFHSGVRIGSDGFGYVFASGAHQKIPHVGRCIIENDVEVGANTTIDRGSIDDTVIGAGTKIDNLVQIGHNVKIGKLCLIMSQVGVAGSTTIGDGCVLAGQAGLGGHIVIGAGARIGGQSGVFGNVPPGETWSGYPARPHRESLRATGALFKLAEMINDLEKIIEDRGTK